MDNRTMQDFGPTDDSGRDSNPCRCGNWACQRCCGPIDTGLDSPVPLPPPATDGLLQPVLATDTSLLEESKLVLSLRQEIRELKVSLQEAERLNAVEVERHRRKIADSGEKRKALGRKLGRKLGESEREKRLVTSQVEALRKENRSLGQKLEQCQNGKSLTRSLNQKLDQGQISEGLSERMVGALQIEKRSPGQKPEPCQKGKELCEQQVDALPKENRSPEQKLDQRQKEPRGRDCKEIGQASPVAPKQKIFLGRKIDASQEHLDFRQLLKEFNQSAHGKKLNSMFMSKLHTDRQSRPVFKGVVLKDPYGNDISTFSGTVIQLTHVKESLEDMILKVLPDRESKIRDEIKRASKMLSLLHMVAKKIKCDELKWTEVDSEGYFFWSLIVAQVNEACHRSMTSASLNRLKKCASDGDYENVDKTVRPAIQAAIRLVSIELATTQK